MKLKCTICCIILLYKCQKIFDNFCPQVMKLMEVGCVWGPDTVRYKALVNMVLICQSCTGSNTKATTSFNSKLKGKRHVRRGEAICHPLRMTAFVFHFSLSVVCPLSLLCGVQLL